MKTNPNKETKEISAVDENFLTEPQQRSLTVTLRLFEQALRKAARLLSEEDEVGILYSWKSHLSLEHRQLIQQKISLTLIDLAELSKELGLESAEYSIESTIMAEMSNSWANLEESQSKRLKGYGELDPRAIELIDPAIEHLTRIALEISNLMSANQQQEKPEDARNEKG